MAFSWSEQVVPAGTSLIPVDVEYLDKSYIYLYLDDVLIPNSAYTWNSAQVIQLNTATTASTKVLLVRRTDKEFLYIMFAEGAAFIKENIDTQNRQFLHLAQELVEGRSIEGFYGDISMNGFRITNLGDAVDTGDAVNKGQLDGVETRVANIEQTFYSRSVSYPYFFNVATESDTFDFGFFFDKASCYLNGVCQTPNYSYIIENPTTSSTTVLFADPVPAGTHVFMRLGEDVDENVEYATATAFGDYVTSNDARSTAIEASVSTLNSSKANAGANSDITSLSGLTTPLSLSQGGVGAATAAGARTNLGLGTSATLDVGTVASTVLAGDAVGRLLNVQVFTASGTYTPTPGTTKAIVEVQGGGGAGGGCTVTAANQGAAAPGGNSGSYAKVLLTSAQIGASQAVTIGAAGAGVSGAAGGAGGTTSLGALISCPGGQGGVQGVASTVVAFFRNAATTAPTISSGTTLIARAGKVADAAITATTATTVYPGNGGDSLLGSGGYGVYNSTGGITGGVAAGKGAGGGGSASSASAAVNTGGAGTAGVVIVYEYS